jgi:hypothetical protein
MPSELIKLKPINKVSINQLFIILSILYLGHLRLFQIVV